MSPDWSAKVEPVPYAKMGNPQSLNLYAYVGNNPLATVDPSGHVPFSFGGFQGCQELSNCGYSNDWSERLSQMLSLTSAQRNALLAKQQNATQKWEAQNEKKVQANIASLPKAPATARMVLTDCEAKSCNYTLTNAHGYVYEHFANDGVAGAKDIGPIGPNDYTTSKKGSWGGYFEDQIATVGGTLDQHRYFTISPSSTYDPNNQMFVPINEAGQDHAYEHLYDASANAPSYVNGISTDSYHQ